MQPAAYLRSYLHRKRELSMEAQARLISGNRPQKHMVWQARYFSCTMPGSSATLGLNGRNKAGHCAAKCRQEARVRRRRCGFGGKQKGGHRQLTPGTCDWYVSSRRVAASMSYRSNARCVSVTTCFRWR